MTTPRLAPERLDAMREHWHEWNAKHEEQEKQKRSEVAAKRATARREARTALVQATRPNEALTVNTTQPIYALELIRRYAKDLASLPPDWRLLRPCLRMGGLLSEQAESHHPDAKQLEQRTGMLRNLLPRELDAALSAILHGMELRAQAREAGAFQFGFAYGYERARAEKAPTGTVTAQQATGEALRLILEESE